MVDAHSTISTGSGRDKVQLLRGTDTSGEIEEGLWYQRGIAHPKAGEQKLLEALTDWESRHNYARIPRTVRHKALQLHISRIFITPLGQFIPFNREYRGVLEHASLSL
ncbi:hypothetical protein LAWASA_4464 [Lawsonibacter asaccharolyticus]|nr:hypothetical protein LAWASA_4464 [Lawsonibacter asaccharolyticus]